MSVPTADRPDPDGADERSERRVQSWSDQWRSRADIGVLVLVAAAFGLSAGVAGLAVGFGLALAWLVLPNVAVFTAGVIALVALVPGDASLLSKALPVGALTALAVTTTLSGDRLRDGAATLTVGAVLTTLVVGVHAASGSLWVGGIALGLVAVAGFVGMTVYELRQRGVFDDE